MAVSWLQAAQRLFVKPPEDTPQPFQLRCACGHVTSGIREVEPQQVGCGGCSRILFVMPRCAYPLPKPPPEVARPKPAPKPSPAAETQAETATTATRVVTPPPPAGPGRLAQWRSATTETVRATSRAVVRKLTPSRFQVLVLVIAAALSLTGYAMYRARQRSAAESVLSETVRRGRSALADGDLEEAARFFQQAAQALDVLGRDDPTSRGIRQQACETTAALRLCPKSLVDLVAEAAGTDAGRFGLSWADSFRASYRDTWLVWETMVSRRTGVGPAEPRFLIDHPVSYQRQVAVLHADLPVFDALGIDSEPRSVVFAAQLQDVVPGPTGGNSWTIVLRPETAFAWCDGAKLEALGLSIDEPTKATLAEQARRLGIGSPESAAETEVQE
jgi:hypothetical protein